MLCSQHLFVDGQGALVERLGLLILALVEVEAGQVVETVGRCRGARLPALLLTDSQGALVERLGFWILGHVIQVGRNVLLSKLLLPGRLCSTAQ